MRKLGTVWTKMEMMSSTSASTLYLILAIGLSSTWTPTDRAACRGYVDSGDDAKDEGITRVLVAAASGPLASPLVMGLVVARSYLKMGSASLDNLLRAGQLCRSSSTMVAHTSLFCAVSPHVASRIKNSRLL
jgi:hypothetical protein